MISLDELQALGVGSSRPERLLVATPCQYDGVDFPQSVPHVEIEAAQWLVEIGVRLLGVNVPSVDPLDSQTLDSHHALMNGGVHIVETLVPFRSSARSVRLCCRSAPHHWRRRITGAGAHEASPIVRPRATSGRKSSLRVC